MWLPEKIYDLLPCLYSASAVVVLWFLPASWPAGLSAAALFFASVFVVYWRYAARIEIESMLKNSTGRAVGRIISR